MSPVISVISIVIISKAIKSIAIVLSPYKNVYEPQYNFSYKLVVFIIVFNLGGPNYSKWVS